MRPWRGPKRQVRPTSRAIGVGDATHAYRHSAGSFDGSTDSYNYAENVFGELFGASKYVNCSREWTLEGVRKAYAKAHPGTQEVIDEGWYNRDYSNQDERSRIHWIRDAWNNCSL